MRKITYQEAVKSHPLARAVLKQLGGGPDAIQSALDAANHGADSGFRGFCYYSDTCAFTRRQRSKIYAAVLNMAEEVGRTCIELIREFRCLDKPSERAIAIALYGARVSASDSDLADEVDLVENALAWFALEEVGHAIESAAERDAG